MSLIIKKNTTFKIPRTGSGAPSGIPVASTTNVIVTFGDTSSLNYARNGYPTFTNYSIIEPTPSIAFQVLDFNGEVENTWALSQYFTLGGIIQATNPSTNSAIIPTTNWIYIIGSGPSITITAA